MEIYIFLIILLTIFAPQLVIPQGNQVFPQMYGWNSIVGNQQVTGFDIDSQFNIAIIGRSNYASKGGQYETIGYYTSAGEYAWFLNNNNVGSFDTVSISAALDKVLFLALSEQIIFVVQASDGTEVILLQLTIAVNPPRQMHMIMDLSDNTYAVMGMSVGYTSSRMKIDISGNVIWNMENVANTYDEHMRAAWTDTTCTKMLISGYLEDMPSISFVDPSNGASLFNVQLPGITAALMTRFFEYTKNCEAGTNCIIASMEQWGVTNKAGLFFAKVNTNEDTVLDQRLTFSGTISNGQIVGVHWASSNAVQFTYYNSDASTMSICDYTYSSNTVTSCLEIASYTGGVSEAVGLYKDGYIYFAGTTNYFASAVGVSFGLTQNHGFLLRLDSTYTLDCITDITLATATLTFNIEATAPTQDDTQTVRAVDTIFIYPGLTYTSDLQLNDYLFCFNIIESLYSDVTYTCTSFPITLSLTSWTYAQYMAGFSLSYSISGAPSCATVDNVALTIDLPSECQDEGGVYTIVVTGTLDADNSDVSSFQMTINCGLDTTDDAVVLDNLAPQLLASVDNLKLTSGSNGNFSLPLAMDPNDDEYTVEVDFGAASSFMEYDADTNLIQYYPDNSIQGQYYISILVYESDTTDQLFSEYSFYIQIMKNTNQIDMSNVNQNSWIIPINSSSSSSSSSQEEGDNSTMNNSNQTANWTNNDSNNNNSNSSDNSTFNETEYSLQVIQQWKDFYFNFTERYISSNIDHISSLGLVTVTFSEYIQIPDNYTSFDDEDLKVEIIPGVASDEDFLAFTWAVNEITTETMKIRIEFADPLYISNLDVIPCVDYDLEP